MSAAAIPAPAEAPPEKLKPPSAAEVARAEAAQMAASLEAPRRRWEAALAELEADLEERLAEAKDPLVERALAPGAEEEAQKALAGIARRTLLEQIDEYSIGAALQACIDSEDELDRVKRLAAGLVERAAAREARVSGALMPLVEAWCDANPPLKGKTWKFTSTLAKVVRKKHDGRLLVGDEARAVKAIESALGMEAYSVLKVKTTVLVGAAYDALRAKKGIDLTLLDGIKWERPGERFEVHRAKGSGGDDAR